ncbi:MAG TPA: hypothetical protein EYP19_02870 [Desulfobacterales bacterium]|nr:hypothetical protein [Desulfobacterales bacterium]
MEAQPVNSGQEPKRRRKKEYCCHVCAQKVPFCWTCRCGFQICQECMMENLWGMTCNAIDWTCPDCGQQCGFGNQ